MDVTEEQAADDVAASFDAMPDQRLEEVMQRAVRHLRSFVCEVRPTSEEREKAIESLSAVGQACTDTRQRQEFILFSDTIGVSMLVATINGAEGGLSEGDGLRPTAPAVLGPFQMTESRAREQLNSTGQGTPLMAEGRVTDLEGKPIPHGRVDTWHADGEGWYDVQAEGGLPSDTGRGLFIADHEGYYWFRSVMPRSYPIPVDGPAGDLVVRAGRAPVPACSPALQRRGRGFPGGRHRRLRLGLRVRRAGRRILGEERADPRLRRGSRTPLRPSGSASPHRSVRAVRLRPRSRGEVRPW